MRKIISNSPVQTQEAGARIGRLLAKQKLSGGGALIIALEGHLGSGKTTFIQGLAEGMGVKENVLSPTFLILKQFPIALKNYKNFYHIDAYRLKNPGEIVELGFKDLAGDPGNIIVIEWAEKIKKILPEDAVKIKFENFGGDKRKITFEIRSTKSEIRNKFQLLKSK